MLSLVDLHRYYPFLEPGDYAMRSFLIITIYQHPGDAAHVVVGSGRWRGLLSEEVVLRVELPEGVKPEEGAALRDARILQGSAIDVEESVAGYLAFADAVVSAHVRAAAAFWLGEAYLAMRAFEQAEDAYRLIATSYTESVFADYVEERLQEVEALRGSGS